MGIRVLGAPLQVIRHAGYNFGCLFPEAAHVFWSIVAGSTMCRGGKGPWGVATLPQTACVGALRTQQASLVFYTLLGWPILSHSG